ncbi:intestinal mucin-like protein [Misgurnus anguillicaudatus]|uniref:intestinal mucin-like protein n=1 Tax=Misgurnus anguillicaudatus TaxID=75329 RepID=UPI003CCF5F30
MAGLWAVQPNCTTPPPQPKPPTPDCKPKICDVIKSNLFKSCHQFVPPDGFYQACKYDVCHMNDTSIGCQSVEAYAKLCGQQSTCIDWRNSADLKGQCAYTCPSNKVYKACGPKVEKTCSTWYNDKIAKDECHNKDCRAEVMEGCFCPNNTYLVSSMTDECTPYCDCIDSDGISRKPGDTWNSSCNTYTCSSESFGIVSEPMKCPNITCPNGYKSVIENCCPTCVCDTQKCFEKRCDIGYELAANKTKDSCCPPCVPKDVCVYKNTEYLPGVNIPTDPCKQCNCGMHKDPNTKFHTVTCVDLTCTPCAEGFEEVKVEGQCCPLCKQNACIYDAPNNTKLIIKVGEVLTQKCESISCQRINDTFVPVKAVKTCPEYNSNDCVPGTETSDADGCCKTCEHSNCVRVRNTTQIHVQGCTSIGPIEVTSCSGHCDTQSMYSMEANKMMHSCSCCRESKISTKQVKLKCPDNSEKLYDYGYTESCECTPTKCID